MSEVERRRVQDALKWMADTFKRMRDAFREVARKLAKVVEAVLEADARWRWKEDILFEKPVPMRDEALPERRRILRS